MRHAGLHILTPLRMCDAEAIVEAKYGTPPFMPSSGKLLHRIYRRLQPDDIRIPIQTAAAVLLAYFATAFMETEDVSWAVFSALFVVQASIGGTIGAALGRIAGAVLGAGIAVALVVLLGTGGWGKLAGLLVGVGLMSFLTAKWPNLAYGLVTVTIITVAPDFHVFEGAFRKVMAIAIGSTCGMIAAFAVMPVRARLTEQAHLATVLRSSGAHILECTACLVQEQEGKDRKTLDTIQQSIERARVMAREARVEERTPAMGLSPFSPSLGPEIERFAYTLTLVDRFSDKPISETLCRDHKEAFLKLAVAVKACLDRIADAVENGKSCEDFDDVWTVYQDFEMRVTASLKEGQLPDDDKEQMASIKRAYSSVLSSLADLACQVQGRQGQREVSA